MKSFEVIKRATEEIGVKAAAAAMKVSPALVYKWCEPPPAAADTEQSGAKNPLDRVADLYALTKDRGLINWLCMQAGGSFVANPHFDPNENPGRSFLNQSHGMLRDFSELLAEVNESYGDDEVIDAQEAEAIRGKWEDLKAIVEHFVKSCEQGHYRAKRKA